MKIEIQIDEILQYEESHLGIELEPIYSGISKHKVTLTILFDGQKALEAPLQTYTLYEPMAKWREASDALRDGPLAMEILQEMIQVGNYVDLPTDDTLVVDGTCSITLEQKDLLLRIMDS